MDPLSHLSNPLIISPNPVSSSSTRKSSPVSMLTKAIRERAISSNSPSSPHISSDFDKDVKENLYSSPISSPIDDCALKMRGSSLSDLTQLEAKYPATHKFLINYYSHIHNIKSASARTNQLYLKIKNSPNFNENRKKEIASKITKQIKKNMVSYKNEITIPGDHFKILRSFKIINSSGKITPDITNLLRYLHGRSKIRRALES